MKASKEKMYSVYNLTCYTSNKPFKLKGERSLMRVMKGFAAVITEMAC